MVKRPTYFDTPYKLSLDKVLLMKEPRIDHIFFFFGFAGWGSKFHHVAIEALEQRIASKFSGLTFGAGTFKLLRDQGDIKYERLDAYETLYVKFLNQPYDEKRIVDLENRYGSLWKYAYADRQLVAYHHNQRYAYYDLSHKQILNVLQGIFDYFEDVVRNYSVDTILTYATASAWAVIAAAVAEHFKCNYFELTSSRNPDCTIITRGIGQTTFATKCTPSRADKQTAIQFLKEFRNKPEQTSYATTLGVKGTFLESIGRRRSVKISKIFKFFADYLRKPDAPIIDVHDPGNLMAPPLLRIREWLIFQIRLLFLERNVGIFHKIPDEKVVFFPLHVEPESATMVMAQFYINIKSLIENISKVLPADYKLCIKEHPSMVGLRPLKYYRDLARIPNVYLMSPDITSTTIIKKAELVVVINGTVGLEAALLGKPVITFGNTHYNRLSTIRHFNNPIIELESFIRDTLNTFRPDDQAIIEFLSEVFANSIKLDVAKMWSVGGMKVDEKHMAKEICRLLKMYLETGNHNVDIFSD